jgi:hypothetical protein
MKSKRAHEGYLLLDHRDSPGLPMDFVAEVNSRSSAPPLPAGAGRGLFEAPTITCSHCQKGVVINPLRNRERAYCAKCDHYICDDPCGLDYKISGGVCRSYKALTERLYEQAIKGGGLING